MVTICLSAFGLLSFIRDKNVLKIQYSHLTYIPFRNASDQCPSLNRGVKALGLLRWIGERKHFKGVKPLVWV